MTVVANPRSSSKGIFGRRAPYMLMSFLVGGAMMRFITLLDNDNDVTSALLSLPTNNEQASLSVPQPTRMSENVMPASALDSADASIFPQRMISDKVMPVSCSHVLQKFQSGEASDPNEGKHFIRRTVTEPHFYLSVHKGEFDPVRFSTFEYGKYYEWKLSEAFSEILSVPGKHHVIDVGGNIGWFSLLSAALGAEVSSFEPNEKNYLRTCESMRLNGWLPCNGINGGCLSPGKPSPEEFNSRIHIYPYGVAEREGNLWFEISESNPGGSRLVDESQAKVSNTTSMLRVVSLDGMARELGWFDTDVSIAKIDVEGAELGVFRGAKELLSSRTIKNIFMEGSGRTRKEIQQFKPIVELLVASGYMVYKIGGWRGPVDTNVPKPDKDLAANVFHECVGKKPRGRAQCNLWWKPIPK